jgi:hypothetical protein
VILDERAKENTVNSMINSLSGPALQKNFPVNLQMKESRDERRL